MGLIEVLLKPLVERDIFLELRLHILLLSFELLDSPSQSSDLVFVRITCLLKQLLICSLELLNPVSKIGGQVGHFLGVGLLLLRQLFLQNVDCLPQGFYLYLE